MDVVKSRYVHWSVIAGAFALFAAGSVLIWIAAPSRDAHYELDSYSYVRVADYFYHWSQLRDPIDLSSMPVYPLGYPLFVGLIYKMGGMHIYLIFLAQALLAFCTMLLTFSIAKQLVSEAVAVLTLYALAMHVGILVYAQLIMSEILVMTLVIAAIERLLRWYVKSTDFHLFQAAGLLGLSLIVKTIALLFVPCFALFVALRSTVSRAFRTLILCLVPAVCCAVYNYKTYGSFQLSPQLAVNVYHYFLPKVIARAENMSYCDARAMIPQDAANPHNRMLLYQYVSADPVGCIMIWAYNMVKTWCGLFTTQLKILLNPRLRGGACAYECVAQNTVMGLYDYIAFGASHCLIVLLGILELLLIPIRTLLMCVGLWGIYHRNRQFALVLSAFIASALVMTGFDGCFRFRMVYEPLIVMCAIAGYVFCGNMLSTWYRAKFQRVM